MSFIDTISPREADGAVRDMYERQQGAWGYVPNYAKSFSHRPEVMTRWGQLLAEIKRPLDKRTFELATFAAAHELRHSSCALAHGKALLEFFGPDEVRAIARQEPVPSLSEAEQALLRFARLVARDAAAIGARDIEELRAHGYSDADVFDIAAAAAARAFFTKLLDAVGSLPDAPFSGLDARFVADLTVGRPIDTHDIEVME